MQYLYFRVVMVHQDHLVHVEIEEGQDHQAHQVLEDNLARMVCKAHQET